MLKPQNASISNEWNTIIGLGVAGNFTGHLEQAGEDVDFVAVKVKEAKAPKGIFPFYVPPVTTQTPHFLHTPPISASTIQLVNDENYQIEPEVSLLCDLQYAQQQVIAITPRYAMAHNDCSIRRHGAHKISQKKNWGAASKGVSQQRIIIDQFSSGGCLDTYRLTSYLLRNGQLHPYGIDSAVIDYSYFYQTLIDWMIDRLNHQVDAGPLEHLHHWLAVAGFPQQALISIGATRYTDFGASHFLQPDDVAIVALYDAEQYDQKQLQRLLLTDSYSNAQGLSVLYQTVQAPLPTIP